MSPRLERKRNGEVYRKPRKGLRHDWTALDYARCGKLQLTINDALIIDGHPELVSGSVFYQ